MFVSNFLLYAHFLTSHILTSTSFLEWKYCSCVQQCSPNWKMQLLYPYYYLHIIPQNLMWWASPCTWNLCFIFFPWFYCTVSLPPIPHCLYWFSSSKENKCLLHPFSLIILGSTLMKEKATNLFFTLPLTRREVINRIEILSKI